MIDTANIYEGYTRYIGSPGGVVEEILGKALLHRRSQVVLATKVGMKIGPSSEDQGLGRKHVLGEIDRSLKRLQTDYVDIYYMHKPDPDTSLSESIEVFNEVVEAGKARYWAVSNFAAPQIAEILRICRERNWRRPVALQPPYSLLDHKIEEDILPLCENEAIAVIPYRVLQGGLLTGKYVQGKAVPPNSRQIEKPEWTLPLSAELFDKLEFLKLEAESKGRTLMQHSLLELLEHPAVVSLIAGVKRTDQLSDWITAVE